ncbi:iron-containing redox enzyme family protein [Kitasatospora sp. MBT63]|uniref:iron-containing redox enzyme family protein n=1 Tax=Kitasatospora sp. MBT63 TaxID=1444768 RepID=UPI00053B8155|nr:iron-containing redox enzyme family protein [Kitasatospora sp. MBT63]
MGVTAVGLGPRLPRPRGPLSGDLVALLTTDPETGTVTPVRASVGSPWSEDHQLALYICYELHYRSFADVDARWEWDPRILGLRAQLERPFLEALRAEVGPVPPLARQLQELLTEPSDGDGLSYFLLRRGERWQAREYLALRSIYHLKEADPQSWVIPRLHGAAQAALVAVQYDEYGAGRPEHTHSRMFAEMMADLGLNCGYGHYLEHTPAAALAVVNLMSLFALHRMYRGALVGQFAGVEITSSPGSARLAAALERLGAGPAGTRFYLEHIEADAVHEQLMRHGVIDALLADEPELREDVAFGLAASTLLDNRLAHHALTCWKQGQSALLDPLNIPAAV